MVTMGRWKGIRKGLRRFRRGLRRGLQSYADSVVPTAAFTSSLSGGLVLSFSDLTTGVPTAWSWDFGDGTTSTDQNPSKTYDGEQVYPVSLTASNALGSTIAAFSLVVVNTDGPDNVFLPTSSAGFTALGDPAPQLLWNVQETTGSLMPTIGTSSLDANGGGHLWDLSVTSWNRKAVGLDDGLDAGWRHGTGEGPSPAVHSLAWFAVIEVTGTVGSNSQQLIVDNAISPLLRLGQTSAQLLILNCSGSTTNGVLNDYSTVGVFPVVLQYDRTNSRVMTITNREAITGTFSADMLNSGQGGIGVCSNAAATAGPWRFLQVACYSGSDAEVDWKQVFKDRGWTVTY